MLHVTTIRNHSTNHSTIRHSHFEREFVREFKRLRSVIGNMKVYKYFLVLITKAQADVMGFVNFESAQIQFTNYCGLLGGDVGKKLIGKPYYIALYMRHADGTCHKMSYKEELQSCKVSVSPRADLVSKPLSVKKAKVGNEVYNRNWRCHADYTLVKKDITRNLHYSTSEVCFSDKALAES